MTSGKRAKEQRRAEAQRQSEALKVLEAKRRRSVAVSAVVAVVILAAAGVGIGFAVSNSGGPSARTGSPPIFKFGSLASLGALQSPGVPGPKGPEGIPVPTAQPLAPTDLQAIGDNVDGIQCQNREQALFHIHVHLTIFVDGTQRAIPGGVGVVDSTCLYWLHSHDSDGAIHIESPVRRTFTLGDFFDEWGQALGPNVVGPASGHVTAIYNGKLYESNPQDLPLTAHAQIQLEVGTPLVSQQLISSWAGL